VEVLTRVRDGALLALFPTRWRLDTISRNNPGVRLEPLLADTDRTAAPARKGAA
jgi:peptide chain release factor 3